MAESISGGKGRGGERRSHLLRIFKLSGPSIPPVAGFLVGHQLSRRGPGFLPAIRELRVTLPVSVGGRRVEPFLKASFSAVLMLGRVAIQN